MRAVVAEHLSPVSLRWVVGPLLASIGALMLVVPHVFATALYDHLPTLHLTGPLLLGSGIALLASAVAHRRLALLLAHLAAGSCLVMLGVALGLAGGWTALGIYLVLGLGTIVGGWLAPGRPALSGARVRGDLFSFLVGCGSVLGGLAMLGIPGEAWGVRGSLPETWFLVLGLLLVVTGLLLARVQVRPFGRRGTVAVHVASGLTLLLLLFRLSLPSRAWTGVLFYGGTALTILASPWLRRRFADFDPHSLRTRFALASAIGGSLGIVLTVAIAADQQERRVEREAATRQREVAASTVRGITDYVRLMASQVNLVATVTEDLAPDSEELELVLEEVLEETEGLASMLVADPDGGLLAEAGDPRLEAERSRELARAQRDEGRPELTRVEAEQGTLLALTSRRGRRVVVAVLDPAELERRLRHEGYGVELTDSAGNRLVEVRAWEGAQAPGRLPPSRAEVRERELMSAEVAVPFLGWNLAVTRPLDEALEGVRRGRELTVPILFLLVGLAVTVGIFAGQWIGRPLAALARASDQLAAGGPHEPVEIGRRAGGSTEMVRLASAFREMRERLSERTAESERLAEELRARAEELSEAAARKDEFLAMLAHELRNPLGAISTSAYILEADLGVPGEQDGGDGARKSDRSGRLDRALGVLRRQIGHLSRLVDDLLDVSRITRGKVELRRERLDLTEVLRESVYAAMSFIEERGHEIAVSLPDEPLPVDADATRLGQIFGNLLRNAAKFTEDGGHIEVRARRQGDWAVAAVRDDGAGLPPELLPKVFDLFTQGRQNLDRSSGGLGIGLTLVARLAELHGGTAVARSDGLGQGAEFEVRLPLAPDGEAARPGGDAPAVEAPAG